jgi:hypothetical protein
MMVVSSVLISPAFRTPTSVMEGPTAKMSLTKLRNFVKVRAVLRKGNVFQKSESA